VTIDHVLERAGVTYFHYALIVIAPVTVCTGLKFYIILLLFQAVQMTNVIFSRYYTTYRLYYSHLLCYGILLFSIL